MHLLIQARTLWGSLVSCIETQASTSTMNLLTPYSDQHACISFLLTVSPLHQTFRSWEKRKWSLIQLEKFLIDKQILLVSTLGNVLRTVWRICILMLGCKGFTLTCELQFICTMYFFYSVWLWSWWMLGLQQIFSFGSFGKWMSILLLWDVLWGEVHMLQ